MFPSPARPSWSRDGADWPNRHASRTVHAAGFDWHVQVMGEGRDVLLLHGTGSSCHSWRDVAPLLARRWRVIVPDLPGHGFTAMPPSGGLSLRNMAQSVAGLVAALGVRPVAGVGHSAGAALLVTTALEQSLSLRGIVAVNGALLPIRHSGVFAPLATLLFLNPLVPRLLALRANSSRAVRRLIEGTGSRLDDRGIELYRRLLSRAGHVEATLGMMANWQLDWLRERLPDLDVPLDLVVAAGDRAVPTSDADDLCRIAPMATRVDFAFGGHLAHEEFPGEMAELLAARIARFG